MIARKKQHDAGSGVFNSVNEAPARTTSGLRARVTPDVGEVEELDAAWVKLASEPPPPPGFPTHSSLLPPNSQEAQAYSVTRPSGIASLLSADSTAKTAPITEAALVLESRGASDAPAHSAFASLASQPRTAGAHPADEERTIQRFAPDVDELDYDLGPTADLPSEWLNHLAAKSALQSDVPPRMSPLNEPGNESPTKRPPPGPSDLLANMPRIPPPSPLGPLALYTTPQVVPPPPPSYTPEGFAYDAMGYAQPRPRNRPITWYPAPTIGTKDARGGRHRVVALVCIGVAVSVELVVFLWILRALIAIL